MFEPDDPDLSAAEAAYAEAARAANTLRSYRSDWREWCAWCAFHCETELPASPAAVSRYLTFLADSGAKVTTMRRRLSAIRFAHRRRDAPDPTAHPRVATVWEGIRRTHGAPLDQSAPLMPPMLWRVLDACPTETRRGPQRPPEPDLAGHRDRALLLVGFVAALRRSEIAALTVDQIDRHAKGLVISLPRSKTNPRREAAELVVVPRSVDHRRCPVTALTRWLELAGVRDGAVFRRVTKANAPGPRALHPASVNLLVQNAIRRAGLDPSGYSAHSLRAGFVTYAHLQGASDRAIAHQTRHRSIAAIGSYIRVDEAWVDNAATELDLAAGGDGSAADSSR